MNDDGLTDEEIQTRVVQLGDIQEREAFFLLRKRAKISQTSVAEEAGITQSYLSAWECGRWEPRQNSHAREYWEALDRLMVARDGG